MATEYTRKVLSGEIETLNEYVIECIKAFGIYDLHYNQENEKYNARMKYYNIFLKDQEESLQSVISLTDEECEQKATKQYLNSLENIMKFNYQALKEEANIRDMLEQIENWETDVKEVKQFMIDQLNLSRQHITTVVSEPDRLSGKEWRHEEIKFIKLQIEAVIKKINDEKVKIHERNLLRSKLLKSLNFG